MSRSLRRVNNEKPEDFLIKYGKAVKDKLDSQRMDNLRKEVEGLDFRPRISKMSERIAMVKDGIAMSQGSARSLGDKFDRLYDDAKRRQERQNLVYDHCIEAECTFQPDTSKTKYFAAKKSSLEGSVVGEVF